MDGGPGPNWHGFDHHRQSLVQLVEGLNLRNILLVVQDWGGLLGLTLPLAWPERITRLLVMNTGLGTGTVTEGFRQWRAYSNSQPDLAVGRLMKRSPPHPERGRGRRLRRAVPRRPPQGRAARVCPHGARR